MNSSQHVDPRLLATTISRGQIPGRLQHKRRRLFDRKPFHFIVAYVFVAHVQPWRLDHVDLTWTPLGGFRF